MCAQAQAVGNEEHAKAARGAKHDLGPFEFSSRRLYSDPSPVGIIVTVPLSGGSASRPPPSFLPISIGRLQQAVSARDAAVRTRVMLGRACIAVHGVRCQAVNEFLFVCLPCTAITKSRWRVTGSAVYGRTVGRQRLSGEAANAGAALRAQHHKRRHRPELGTRITPARCHPYAAAPRVARNLGRRNTARAVYESRGRRR